MFNSPVFGGIKDRVKQEDFSCHPAVVEVGRMLTCEDSRSFFCSELGGKLAITTETVKSFVVDKLRDIITTKIAKMDADYQEILKTNGDYKKYRHFESIDATVNELMQLVANTPKLPNQVIESITAIRNAHVNIVKSIPQFKDSFIYNVPVIKQYYLTIVASIIYATGFTITSMLDYERRDGQVDFTLIFKNQNLLERGLPKNMMTVIHQFNSDIKDGKVFAHIKEEKEKKPKSALRHEVAIPLVLAGVAIGLIMLPAIIRYVIYFFMYSKVKLADYIRTQAFFLELNAKSAKKSGVDEKYISKQEEYVQQLRDFAAKISADKYATEKIVDKEIAAEDKQVVRDSDDDTRKTNSNSSTSTDLSGEIIL